MKLIQLISAATAGAVLNLALLEVGAPMVFYVLPGFLLAFALALLVEK